jgi:hypothetical protein
MHNIGRMVCKASPVFCNPIRFQNPYLAKRLLTDLHTRIVTSETILELKDQVVGAGDADAIPNAFSNNAMDSIASEQ